MSDLESRVLDGGKPPQENLSLYGHEADEAFLAKTYKTGKSHHAFLIEGPQGIGKATLAFRFANHVLAYPDPESAPDWLTPPDPASPFFHQIAAGACHNLIHLVRPNDEKTGKLKKTVAVDEVRKVGKFFGQTSGNGNWRIVIIDTADDLNRNGANAILKILEEPPKQAMFLVLSNHPGRLLPTIRSRCMPLILRPLSDEAMGKALSDLGVAQDPAMMSQFVAASGGSVATALKLINYGGMDIMTAFDAMLVAQGPTQRQEMHRLADALSAKASDVAFEFFADRIESFLLQSAKQQAIAGNLARADRLSRLYSAVSERLSIAEGYNLDRKQTVISLLEDVTAQ